MILKKYKLKNYFFLNIFFAFTLFVSINILSNKFLINQKLDLTQDKLYTLSSNTKNILENLNEQIKIQLFFF